MSTKLESVLTTPRDITYGIVQPGPHIPGGIPIVRVTDIRNGRVAADSPMRVAESVAAPFKRSRLQGGELLITLVGTVGECAVAPMSLRGWNTARAVGVARVKCEVGAEWVALCLRSQDVQERILARVNTTVQTTLNLKDLRDLPIVLPPSAELRRLASLARALDNKMESNRALLGVVLQLMSAEMHAATRYSGAKDAPVTTLARFVNGGAYTKGATGSGRMVLRIAELNSGPGRSTVYTKLEVPDDKTARAGDLLMSWSGSLDIYRWTREEAIINQHIFKVIPNDLPAWLVHDRLKEVMPIFQSIAKDKATTMGHIQRGHLESTSVLMPSSEQIARLDASLGPLWDRAAAGRTRDSHPRGSARRAAAGAALWAHAGT